MVTLQIKTENAAFDGINAGTETARIMRQCAEYMETWDGTTAFSAPVTDTNGNRCGMLTAEER